MHYDFGNCYELFSVMSIELQKVKDKMFTFYNYIYYMFVFKIVYKNTVYKTNYSNLDLCHIVILIYTVRLPSSYTAGTSLTRAVPANPHIGNTKLLQDPFILRYFALRSQFGTLMQRSAISCSPTGWKCVCGGSLKVYTYNLCTLLSLSCMVLFGLLSFLQDLVY